MPPKRKAAQAADDARDAKKAKLAPKKFGLEWGTAGKVSFRLTNPIGFHKM